MDDLIQQGINAYKSGDRENARKLLIAATKQFPDDERSWGWLYNVCISNRERIQCLKQVLRINPKNEKASKLLSTLAEFDIPIERQPSSHQTSTQTAPPMRAGSDVGTRILGFVFFLLSAGLGYMEIYSPIIKAIRGDHYIIYSNKAVVAVPVGMFFGLFLIVFGAKGLEKLHNWRPSKLGLVVMAILTLVYTFGSIALMDYILKSFGYY